MRRRGRAISSRPLAGTVARSGDAHEDARLAAASFLRRRTGSSTATSSTLLLPASPDTPTTSPSPTPELLELRNVTHLATSVAATLHESADGRLLSVLALALELHPTPAVGGTPRSAALAYLAKNEGFDRGRFAGPVGWFDASGDGEWWIGIRSALVDGRTARLFAGVGIVEGSEPSAELAETQLKLQALLAAFVRP